MKILPLSLFLVALAMPADAHFGVLTPSAEIIDNNQAITIDLRFMHPAEQSYMELERPAQFGLLQGGKKIDLLPTLKRQKGHGPQQQDSFTFWQTEYQPTRPGDYTFYMEPQPYWEPSENTLIIHYTKVCVNAFGLEESWDAAIGLPTEIIPLTRPYGLWTGNIFTGRVLLNGQPAADTEVEIEHLRQGRPGEKGWQTPAAPFITQVVKTDSNGIFSYAMPRAGWWGFSALSSARQPLEYDGKKRDVELGAVYWVHAQDMP